MDKLHIPSNEVLEDLTRDVIPDMRPSGLRRYIKGMNRAVEYFIPSLIPCIQNRSKKLFLPYENSSLDGFGIIAYNTSNIHNNKTFMLLGCYGGASSFSLAYVKRNGNLLSYGTSEKFGKVNLKKVIREEDDILSINLKDMETPAVIELASIASGLYLRK